MHGDEHDEEADEKVARQLVAENCVRHERCEGGGDGTAVLLEDGVCEFIKEGRQDALRRSGGDQRGGGVVQAKAARSVLHAINSKVTQIATFPCITPQAYTLASASTSAG